MLRAACATCTRVHGTRVDEQAETEGYHISFIDFFKVGFPVMLISVAVANVYLFMLNALFVHPLIVVIAGVWPPFLLWLKTARGLDLT